MRAGLSDNSEFAFALPGEPGRFTRSERELLWLLHRGQGRVVRHQALWDALYSTRPGDVPDHDIVKVFISKMRRKLRAHRLESVFGIGYRLVKIDRTARLHFRPVVPQGHSSGLTVTPEDQICSRAAS